MSRLRSAALFLLAATRVGAVTLTILHTSDLHGRVHPEDELAAADLGEGLARVAAVVRSVRAEGGLVLVLDSGDSIEGAPAQSLTFAGRLGTGDGTDPTIRAMNLVGYDAMAVGNHEFDFGRARLEQSARQARFPFLSANTLGEDGEPVFPPYVVKQVGGVRVGLLGLVTPRVANWESPSRIEGLHFGDSVEAARRWVPVLRGRERCALVVVLAHESFERDPRTGAERRGAGENQAWAVATRVPGIDLLLSGHEHAVVAPQKLQGVWVSQPGRYGNTVTRFDVTFEKSGESWSVAAIAGRNIHTRRFTPEADVAAAVLPEHAAAMQALAAAAAVLDEPASGAGARRRDSAMLDWVAEVERREGHAELAFASMLPAKAPEWPAGPLAVRQIWGLYPYENGLVTLEATGRQVRAALERSAACMRSPAELGRNCDALSGADYVLDLARPEGRRVVSLARGGREIEDADVLTVALNSYRASGGGGYPMWKSARRLAETGNVRDLLIADARARKRLRLVADGNWKVLGNGSP